MHPDVRATLRADRAARNENAERGRILKDAKNIVAEAKAKGLIKGPNETTAVVLNGAVAHVDGITAQFVTVTPEIARAWLANNKKNRSLRPATVKQYAQDMSAGQWLVTHQGVAFNDRQELIDGQHRLSAVVESGTEVTMLVVLGLASQPKGKKLTTMDAVDCGMTRTLADQLHLQHDMQNAAKIAGCCRTLAVILTDGGLRGKMTMPKTLSIIEVYRPGLQFAITNRSTSKGLRHTAVLAMMTLIWTVNESAAAPFYRCLTTGENLTADSPILHLRNWLIEGGADQINKYSRLEYCAQSIAHAFKLFAEKKSAKAWSHSKEALRELLAWQGDRVTLVKSLFS